MKKVGLFFGTYNPIHVGHLVIANHLANYTELDEVWLVVSPQNPLKKKDSLLQDYHRLALVRVAIEDNPKLKASDIEFSLPKPSYTSNTLAHINEKYPDYSFALIMGEDNLRTFHKWKNYADILKNNQIYVYPRVLTEQEKEVNEINVEVNNELRNHQNVIMCDDVPVMKISASFIRGAIKEKKDVSYLLTQSVFKYLTEMHFYEK
ncbi:nicotinate (nicotinamide) nucleotide adenylyltransferase [Flavobacteriales bacterium]|nr:nicotinate (nicotinamide) nucleotide adenylyltransferase [Flavobacteriales bacterium]